MARNRNILATVRAIDPLPGDPFDALGDPNRRAIVPRGGLGRGGGALPARGREHDAAARAVTDIAPLELRFTVGCPPGHAFATWAERTSLWWPHGHSVSAEPGLTVTFEPRAGGRIYERTPDGVEHDWGEVLDWEPPRRLTYLWHLRFDRADATEVEISFARAPEGTAVA